MKIASYNVENLFERAVALSGETNAAEAQAAIVAQGESTSCCASPCTRIAIASGSSSC